MEQLAPMSFAPRPMQPMMNNPGSIMPPGPYPGPNMATPLTRTTPPEQDQKRKEFAKGIFVSGFEKCVTTAMIQKHFSIKPIQGLKHPMTKHKESKQFAFIYYGSEDDAMHVKKTLDRTAILKEKIRITRTVISENLSKMMFKLKTAGFSEKKLIQHETTYFNDQNLEKEVQRIITPLFGNTVQINKITIPKSKGDKKPLRYARVFFYVSDVKDAKTRGQNWFKGNENPLYDVSGKNQYEIILNCISELINNDDKFQEYAKSEIYQYTKKNQANVLHLKGVKINPKEDKEALIEQLRQFMQAQRPHWNIINVYAHIDQKGVWANITFATHEETIQAYELLKNERPKFRDSVLYGSLRNVKDLRTVVISVVKKDVRDKQVERFLNELASKSAKVGPLEDSIRKYDYFSFNIIESKRFFKTNGYDTRSITQSEKDLIQPFWIEMNEVPRRLIIHFFHQFNDEDIKELINDITVMPEYQDIFLKGDSKRQLRSNHQKGHVNKDGVYVKHTEMKGKRKPKQPKGDRPPRKDITQRGMQNRPNFSKPNINFEMGGLPLGKQGAPKMGNMNMPTGNPAYRPPPVGVGSGNLGNIPPAGQIRAPGPFPGSQPPQFGMNAPNMSSMPPPNLSSMPPPNISSIPPPNAFKFSGPPISGPQIPPMTSVNMPPNMNPPTGNIPPQMGNLPPPQGSNPPNMPPPQGIPQGGMLQSGMGGNRPPMFNQNPINFPPKPQQPPSNE